MAVSSLLKSGTAWIERAVLLVFMMFFCIHTLPQAWKTLNTDFPNYYLAAQLAHEGQDTSRMYEWSWIEREKDHRAIDIRVIGLLPITPFSTLVIWPLTFFKPLVAKHIWILLNLAFLIPIGWLLHSLTELQYRRIGLAIILSFPMYRNLLYGQFYIFLLLLILGACYSYLRGWRVLAGALVAIAAACKVFPVLLFVFFLQRRDWRALISGIITGCCAVAVSIAVFGFNAHRIWLQEILPWVMHGEGLGTYTTTASISGVLHCLFLSEPQWNPHPWHDSPLTYSLLAPFLQMLTMAPAILLLRRGDISKRRILLEWSALLTAALAVSTIPASYNFVLMVFPACVLASILLAEQRYGWLFALVVAYLGISFPLPVPTHPEGLALLLYVPRLYLVLVVLLGMYLLLWRDPSRDELSSNWIRYAWVIAMTASVLIGIRSTLSLEQGERREFAYRLPPDGEGFLNANPEAAGGGTRFAAFTFKGYQLVSTASSGISPNPSLDTADDVLSFTTTHNGHVLAEYASSGTSRIADSQAPSRTIVEDAHDPMVSLDGQDLAFIRNDHGRGRLMLRRSFMSVTDETELTLSAWNVYEASYLQSGVYAFSAVENGAPPQIFLTDSTHSNSAIGLNNSRYPALSPDGRWLAYSHLDHGVWNLWLRDEKNGETRRIADVPCNEVQPSWESDSKTLLYGSDCGRSVWFTAVARRKVIP